MIRNTFSKQLYEHAIKEVFLNNKHDLLAYKTLIELPSKIL